MTWQECFEKYHYKALIAKNADDMRSLDIGMFLEEGGIPDELRQIYLSRQKDELFLILQPKPSTDIQTFCAHWDSRIMSFINFGCLPKERHEVVEGLRYSITQILMYSMNTVKHAVKLGSLPLMECPTSFSEEKSVSVSRKIFLPCDENDAFDDKSRMLLPFWYDELEGVGFNSDNERKLNALLPKGEMEACLCKKRIKLDRRTKNVPAEQLNFTDEEFAAVKGWLEQ